MFFRILKKDLKRKKVMNAILLCFILLATMFVASGISNVVSVMNGTDSYLDKAGIGDYVVISMGADSKANIDEILHEMESIRDYRIEPVVFGEKSNLKDMDGEELEAKNSVIYQSVEDSQLKFFDKSFNRFLIISLDVLICRYSPLFRAFPALFISEEPHKSFYYPLCFRSQK